MNNRYIFSFLLALLSFTISAQTLEEAKTMFNDGDYEGAKPVFERLAKATPNNGQYNLWYGVCCLRTGSPQTGLKYLQTAVKRRTPSGQFYLAEAYDALYQFDEAIKNYEAYIADLTKRKRPTEEAEKAMEKAKTGLRMLKNVEEICVIDSFVVDKVDFLNTYKLSEEAGNLYSYNEYFDTEGDNPGTVFETELRNHLYYGSMNEVGEVKIFARHKYGDEWSSSSELPERINGIGNNNYPYVMTDGITIFFASTGEHSIGGYDIFATRYNSDNNTYLIPQNIGMPFNSPFNDYMFVIDEYSNLGWFASDRYQPEDKVCVYVFVPNNSSKTYNFETIDKDELIALAQLSSIETTWKDSIEVEEGLQRLEEVINYIPTPQSNAEFIFILDDNNTYYHYTDFRSAQAKELFKQYQQKNADLKKQIQKLESLREEYIAGNSSDKTKLTPPILDLEKRVNQMELELTALETQIRNVEKRQK